MVVWMFLPVLLMADIGVATKIVDGDTVYFRSGGKEIKCRVAYIDTPEKSRNARAKKIIEHCPGTTLERMVDSGKKAKTYAKTLITVGTKYAFDVVDIDRYERSVCKIRLPSGESFNLLMVEEGFAVPYNEYLPEALKREYAQAAAVAKRGGAGLWGTHRAVMGCLKQ